MATKKNIHTVPTDDGWANRREGAKRASSTHGISMSLSSG
jgi:hypothetical protein